MELIFTKKEVRKNSKINIYLIGDKEIQDLNKKHRGKDYPTDVLSFEMDENLPSGEYYLGDILINIDQAQRQMEKYGNKDIRLEIAQLAEHGVLHLLGIHHKED